MNSKTLTRLPNKANCFSALIENDLKKTCISGQCFLFAKVGTGLCCPRFSEWLQFSMSIARKFWSPATRKVTEGVLLGKKWFLCWLWTKFVSFRVLDEVLVLALNGTRSHWEGARLTFFERTYDLWFAYEKSCTTNQLSGGVEWIAEILLWFLVLLQKTQQIETNESNGMNKLMNLLISTSFYWAFDKSSCNFSYKPNDCVISFDRY